MRMSAEFFPLIRFLRDVDQLEAVLVHLVLVFAEARPVAVGALVDDLALLDEAGRG